MITHDELWTLKMFSSTWQATNNSWRFWSLIAAYLACQRLNKCALKNLETLLATSRAQWLTAESFCRAGANGRTTKNKARHLGHTQRRTVHGWEKNSREFRGFSTSLRWKTRRWSSTAAAAVKSWAFFWSGGAKTSAHVMKLGIHT